MKPSENEVWKTIGGWYDDEHCDLLYGLACGLGEGDAIVELGAFNGKSGLALALSGRKTYLIDNFAQDDCREVLRQNIIKMGLEDNVVVLEGFSWTFGQGWPYGEVALLHVDAGHEEEDVERDLQAWLPHVKKPGGIVMIHDFNDERKPGVTVASKRVLGEPTKVHEPAPFEDGKSYIRTWLAEYRL
jgi:predicted O-methyltransferase YrrM